MEPVIASGAVVTTDRENEKMHWYREVLALEPASRVFLPFARLLADTGQTEQAISALRDGLVFHPEFVEARLFLIELLHKGGHTSACRTETVHLTEVFRKYPGFWDAWASQEEEAGSAAELPLVLQLLGILLHGGGVSLTDILAAGLRTLTHKPQPDQTSEPQAAAVQPFAEEVGAEVGAVEEVEKVALEEFVEEPAAKELTAQETTDADLAVEEAIAETVSVAEFAEDQTVLETETGTDQPHEIFVAEPVVEAVVVPAEAVGGSDTGLTPEDMEQEVFLEVPAPEARPDEGESPEIVVQEGTEAGLESADIFGDNSVPDGTEVVGVVPEPQPEIQPELLEDETQTLAVDELDDILDSIGAADGILPDNSGADVPDTDTKTPTGDDIQPEPDSEPMFEFADAEPEPAPPAPAAAEPDLSDLDLSDLDLSDLVAASPVPESERESNAGSSPVSEAVSGEDEAALEVDLDGLDSLDSLLEGQNPSDPTVPDVATAMPEVEFTTEEAVGETEGSGLDDSAEEAVEKCSLRTRSMAEVLAEQGDLHGAVGIYEELLAQCVEEDRRGLENRLEELKARLGADTAPDAPDTASASSAPKQNAGNAGDMVNLLEKLAVRLENKAAAKRPA